MAKRTKYANDNLPKISMEEAAVLAGFHLDRSKNTTKADCPFCGGKKKFYITTKMPNSPLGIAHCMKCGETLSPIGMFAYSQNIDDYKEAANQWYKMQRGEEMPESKKQLEELKRDPKRYEYKRIDVDPAPLSVRDRTYTELLSLLTLLPHHQENLRKRGLSDSAISAGGYKSTPVSQKNAELIVQTLLQRGCVLVGVPGFYTDETGKWRMVTVGEGFFIPQRNGFGQIQGMQIRRDTAEKGKRYISFSSRERKDGSPSAAYCHLRKGRKGFQDVIITEGPLKADIIAFFTGYTVLAVPGVNSLSYLPQALFDLKNVGMLKATIAFDMDLKTNEAVQKAEKKLKGLLCRAGIPHSVLNWDESLKGLDDWAVVNLGK